MALSIAISSKDSPIGSELLEGAFRFHDGKETKKENG